jgi:hypothetical protein
MEIKTIVCLANSRKHSGRCVAGIELVDHTGAGWVRPVSDRPGGEVAESEREYQDGSDPRILDVVSIPLTQPSPHGFQSENWLLDPQYYWEKVGRATWTQVVDLEERPSALWINGSSTYHGINDRVPEVDADALTTSLTLIRVEEVTLQVHAPGESFGNPRRVVAARFTYAGAEYALRVTDPTYERTYKAQPDGYYRLGEAFLTVSLGETWDGYAYKLVAAIIERVAIEGGGGA